MKPIFTFAFAVGVAHLAAAQTVTPDAAKSPLSVAEPPATLPGYKLVWNDEFNRDGAPDTTKWNYEMGFVRNKEPQWYQPQNARVEGGVLVIEARREKIAIPTFKEDSKEWQTNRRFAEFTSASLTTKEKIGWTYGHFECRARIDVREASWPAFWTVGMGRDWPAKGEVDIMEYYNSGLLANFFWAGGKNGGFAGNAKTKPIKNFTDPEWANKFHVWTMDWDATSMTLKVDGETLNTQDITKTINTADNFNPFQSPQYIILNQAIGHGNPEKTPFPMRFEVDYVRVYQKA
ncbi:glycoside hydrolase family 16 protein [bacterium]|nr:MAG: glycoside hydrolase family 16 protein [bacterium]